MDRWGRVQGEKGKEIRGRTEKGISGKGGRGDGGQGKTLGYNFIIKFY